MQQPSMMHSWGGKQELLVAVCETHKSNLTTPYSNLTEFFNST